MQVPEAFRCCVCLAAKKNTLLTECAHHICASCVETGKLQACPVCNATLPSHRSLDADFASEVSSKILVCDCGSHVPLLEAEMHSCEHTQALPKSVVAPVGSRRPPAQANRSTFACPLCDVSNLTRQGLLDHCTQRHAKHQGGAVCPICVAMPWGDPNIVSPQFVAHLQKRHKCDYEVLADFGNDEDASLKHVLAASAQQSNGADEDAILQMILKQSAQEARGMGSGAPHFDESEDDILARILAESARDAGYPSPVACSPCETTVASFEAISAEQRNRQRDARLARFGSTPKREASSTEPAR